MRTKKLGYRFPVNLNKSEGYSESATVGFPNPKWKSVLSDDDEFGNGKVSARIPSDR